ncbi:MAG: MBOAT family protein [Prevotellaceae bacterium]|jgi:D-alanyl-lipoteichoic acid acyltransferase DltB (MBOAT superfamily)|nr:MBOAT family protein [Prevotellaceae bacterium]
MLFNSITFALFLPVVFALYWLALRRHLKLQNLLLVAASYVFYGWWDGRFLLLIALTSFCSYGSGLLIQKIYNKLITPPPHLLNNAKLILAANIVLNLGILAVFKYFSFFAESFAAAFAAVGVHLQPCTLGIILPVGISFYTFQALSYSIDVYRKKIEASRDVVAFFAFVSFFPQLVAGPIERAANLLPQFYVKRKADYKVFRGALLLMAWGFFKKLMIADRLAIFVDKVYGNAPAAEGLPLVVGVLFFAFQLYLDFSAYSDIAIGTARLFGFSLMTNFKRPYLSASFGNFWKRWHISLSSWFQDYVYIPLGGSRRGKARTMVNVLIVFAVSGLWHGASWNFVVWGALNALFMVALDPLLARLPRKGAVSRCFRTLFVSACWALSLVFFRAKGFEAALDCFRHLSFSNVGGIASFGLNAAELKLSLILIGILLLKEMVWERDEALVPKYFYRIPPVFRLIFYVAFVLALVYFGQYGNGNENSFIYFQF